MRLVIDSGEVDPVEARAYVASIVGPRRAPNGRGSTFPVQPQAALIARNNTTENVLFIQTFFETAIGQFVGGVELRFTKSGGSGPRAAFLFTGTTGNSQSFVLYPGEELYVSSPNPGTINVFEARF